MRDIVVFSGNAHPQLAEHICQYLSVSLSQSTINRFSNDCIQVQLNANCREADVFLIQPLVPPVQDHLMELIDRLRERGVNHITVSCTHGLFTGQALPRLGAIAEVKELVTTDTVPLSSQSQCPPNLTTLSVAPLLGEAIRRIHHGESVSSLFTAPDWIVDTG